MRFTNIRFSNTCSDWVISKGKLGYLVVQFEFAAETFTLQRHPFGCGMVKFKIPCNPMSQYYLYHEMGEENNNNNKKWKKLVLVRKCI